MRRPSRVHLFLFGLSTLSALAAVVLSSSVFPHLSINNDEPINRLAADAIAHGRLFPPTMGFPDAFRPWLAAGSGDHYVLKYTPLVPAMMALSHVAAGSPALYLAAVAAGTVVVTFLLAREVLGSHNEALLATVLFAVSPLVLVQSALLLSYLPTLLFLETFAWALIRALATGRNRMFAVSGTALGLAFFARSYDAVVFSLPWLAWALFGRGARRVRRVALPNAAFFLAPLLAALGAFLLFNLVATGHVLRPSFSLLEPQDTLGFGPRKLYPTDLPHHFGVREGVTGVVRHAALFNWWVAGGTVLILLATIAVVRRRLEGPAWALVAVAVVVPMSYVVFWGPWNATVLWGGTRYVGPFYFLPVIVPVAVCGARGVVDLYRWRPRGGTLAVASVAVFTAAALVPIVRANLAFTRDNESLHRLITERPGDLLVLAAMPTPFLMHPTPVISNRWDVSGRVVYAVERGDDDVDVVRARPGRTLYRLRFEGDFVDPDQSFRARLEEVSRVTGSSLQLTIRARPPASAAAVTLAVSAHGLTREYSLRGGAREQLETLVVDHGGALLAGRVPDLERRETRTAGLEVELILAGDGAVAGERAARASVPVRVTGDTLDALVPSGRHWTTGPVESPMLEVLA